MINMKLTTGAGYKKPMIWSGIGAWVLTTRYCGITL